MHNLVFNYFAARNFMCFGPEGIELDLTSFGNIVCIKGENRDRKSGDEDEDENKSRNGVGKCFAKGTCILMFDGSIRRVEEILVGDLVMGPDSNPRKVLSLGSGKEEMFRIIPKKGDSYVVNLSHILALKKYGNGSKVNLSVSDYLKTSNKFKNEHLGYRAAVNFLEQKTDIDPYFFGFWLGDGNSHNTGFTTFDNPVLEYVTNYAKSLNLAIRSNQAGMYRISSDFRTSKPTEQAINASKLSLSGKNVLEISRILEKRPSTIFRWLKSCKAWSLDFLKNGTQEGDVQKDNILLALLRKNGVINNKHIPDLYKFNDRKTRIRLLAGLIDSDGSLSHNCYDYVSVSKSLAQDVVFLARSLGFAAYLKPTNKKCQNGFCGHYWRVTISGDLQEIPVLLSRKKASCRKINKDVLSFGIKKVESVGIGEYFGFTVDKDHLFLLEDFTVVHNSSIPEIPVYTLYGKTIKKKEKLNQESLIHNKIGKNLRTEIRWGNFRVVRTRKPNSLRIWENPERIWPVGDKEDKEFNKKYEISRGGIPATQELVEEKLGMSYETFVNTGIFRDNNSNAFLECDTPTKRSIVENLLSLGHYRVYGENAKKIRNSHKDKIDLMAKNYEKILAEVEAANRRIVKVKSEEEEWRKARKFELSKLIGQIKTKQSELSTSDTGALLLAYTEAQEEIKKLNEAIPAQEESLLKIKKLIAGIELKSDQNRKQRDNFSFQIQSGKMSISRLENDSKNHQKTVYSFESMKDTKCSMCLGTVKEENYGVVVEKCLESINNNKTEIGKIKLVIEQQEKELSKLKAEAYGFEKNIQMGQDKSKEINAKMVSARSRITELSQINKPETSIDERVIQEQIGALKQQAIAKQKESEGPTPYIEILKDSIADWEMRLQDSQAKKAELVVAEEELPYYEFWVKAFGDNGIRKFVIDGIIEPLNSRIAYWMEFLISGKIKLTFDNELNELIESNPSDGDPFVYYAMSAGECRRLNLAVSQAFAYVMMLNIGASPSFVFLDEVTSNIDPQGVEGVYAMIQELSKTKQVFITTHDHDLLQILSGYQAINLVKQDGFTTLVK